MQMTHWKEEIADLRTCASLVDTVSTDTMSARTAARCLSGVVALVTRRWGQDVMQRACADLVRFQPAWHTQFGTLPRVNGQVPEPIDLLAVVARGMLPIAGAECMRAALAFWASEDDPAAWQRVTGT